MKRTRMLWTMLILASLCMPLWAAQGEESRDPGNPLDQGGETCATAVAITTIPFCDNGTTAGHFNDYPVPCNTGSAAPDVVYTMTPPTSATLSFSLCGSAYNTALTIWRGCPSQGGVLVCCSDNVCGDDACCSGVLVLANVTYFIVVDGGLAPNSGNYTLNVVQGETCPSTACNNCPYPNLDVEPNNTCTSPTTTVTCGDTICGFMEANANDFYIFSIPGPGSSNITIDVFGNDTPGWFPFGQGLNPRVEVQSCTASFGNDSDSGIGNDARLDSLCLPAGTYLLRVAAEPQSNSGPYIVAIHCTPCQSVCPFPSLDLEPTNDNCTANIPNITCGDTLCGNLSTTADRDWYRLSFTQFPCVDVHIAVFGDDTPGHFPFGQGLNPKVSIYADDCTTLIAQDSDGGTGLDALLDSLCLRAGTYNVLVESEGAPGPYELWVWCTGCDCPSCLYPDVDNEPNNICAGGGGIITCGDTVCGYQELQANDYYYFRVLGPGCQNVTIDVFGDDTPGFFPFGQGLNPLVALYDASCTLIVGDVNSGTGEDARIDSVCLVPGTYRLHVAAQPQATNSGPYIIATSCSPCPCPDTCEYPSRDNEGVNNTCGTFNPPTQCGDTLCGELTSPTDNVDWYLLTVVGPGLIRVKLDVFGDDTPGFYPFGLGLDPMVRLVGVGCTSILGVDTASGVGEDASLEICVPQGSYNIQVQQEDFTSGPYILAITCTPCDTCPYPSRDQEPLNNQCGTFNPLLECGSAVCGEVDHGAAGVDDDWYLIQITECTQFFIDALGDDTPGFYPFGRGLNTALELWSADCQTMLFSDLSSGQGEDAQLNTQCLPPGFYMLRVYGELATEGPYILFIGCESCTCTPPCEVPCPQDARLEGEPCPANVDTINGGCDTEPHNFLELGCESLYCGTSYSNGVTSDNDWYFLPVLQPTQVRLCASSEFDGTLSIYNRGPGRDGCENMDLIECTPITACQGFQCLSVCLTPGVYYINYEPQPGQVFSCWNYVLGAVCSDCEPTRCEAPDSVVIHFPDTIGVGNELEDIVLYWPPVPGVDEYRIYRTSDPVGVFIPSPLTYVATTTDTFFVHEDIIPLGNPVEEFIYYVLGYCRRDFPPCDVAPAVVMPPTPDIITPRN